MTIASTIIAAQMHADNGNVSGACRILDAAIRAHSKTSALTALRAAKDKIISEDQPVRIKLTSAWGFGGQTA